MTGLVPTQSQKMSCYQLMSKRKIYLYFLLFCATVLGGVGGFHYFAYYIHPLGVIERKQEEVRKRWRDKLSCPMEIKPGVSIGPIHIGQSRETIPILKGDFGGGVSDSGVVPGVSYGSWGGISMVLCKDRVREIEISNVAALLDCLSYQDTRLKSPAHRRQSE